MPLKPVTLRLDEEEYEKLKAHLSKFGDPDINVAYVLRAYIRDLNRALPFLINSGWDLKNYFGLLGSWLKQFGSITDVEMLARMTMNPWTFWKPSEAQAGSNAGDSAPLSSGESVGRNDQQPNVDGSNV